MTAFAAAFRGRSRDVALLWGLFALVQLAYAQSEPRVIEYGVEQRVRNENWNNLYDFNDAADDQRIQVRYRTRLWAKLPLTHNIELFAGVNHEMNHIVVQRCPWRADELVFDNLYLDVKKLLFKGLTLRAGRQNIVKGEGFLLIDGSPYDGSRTQYMNAVNLGYNWKRSKLEAIAIIDPTRDHYLPVYHARRTLMDWNDRAIGAYYTDENLRNTTLEAYYFYKTETGDPRAPSDPQYQPDRRLHTTGARLVRTFSRNWTVTAEAARQAGHQAGGSPISAWGSHLYLKRAIAWRGQPTFQFGHVAFSGDNPSTKQIEGWDPIFSRWPKWSELYLYSLWREHGLGYWSNIRSWQAEFSYTPWKPVRMRFTYFDTHAFHRNAGDSTIFSNGTDRGDNYQLRADFRINSQWNTHVVYESFRPGNFYTAANPSYFLRFEVLWSWKGKITGSKAATRSTPSPRVQGS